MLKHWAIVAHPSGMRNKSSWHWNSGIARLTPTQTKKASMPLPELIEIVPVETPVRAEITVPGSKSITNRALILAALADGETILQGALWSEDTQVMVEALSKLGFELRVEPDP